MSRSVCAEENEAISESLSFWQVVAAADLGTTSAMQGTIISSVLGAMLLLWAFRSASNRRS